MRSVPNATCLYDRPIGVRLLLHDPTSGAEHYLIRYPPGLMARTHRHAVAHPVVVLEGRLEANWRQIGPGSYCHFPAGQPMHHAPANGGSCLFVTIFPGPFDVQPIDQREPRRGGRLEWTAGPGRAGRRYHPPAVRASGERDSGVRSPSLWRPCRWPPT